MHKEDMNNNKLLNNHIRTTMSFPVQKLIALMYMRFLALLMYIFGYTVTSNILCIKILLMV